jgi:hypothetical protein
MDARETRYACGRLRFPLVGEERSMLERRDGTGCVWLRLGVRPRLSLLSGARVPRCRRA